MNTEVHTAPIDSRIKSNATGIHVEQGYTYRYAAVGIWHDAWIQCDADGWNQWWAIPLSPFKRCRDADWFQLVADVGDATVPLGTCGTFVAPASGELRCYANDGDCAYANNRGSITLTVARVD